MIVSQITGSGHFVPENAVPNELLEQRLGLTRGWIAKRTGIHSRRWAGTTDTLIDMAVHAGNAALQDANVPRDQIGLTILATSTPDQLLPPTAPLLTHRLGLQQSGAFDLSGACCGFLYALAMADGFLRAQQTSVLVVAANILSRRLDLSDKNTAIIFADAAGAVVLSPCSDVGKGLVGLNFISDGSGFDLISLADGKMVMREGGVVFNRAVQMMVACGQQALSAVDAIDYFIPHQANARIMQCVAEKLGISPAKTLSALSEFGNSSAASIPLTLSLARQHQNLNAGSKLLLTAAGAGMSAAGVIIKM